LKRFEEGLENQLALVAASSTWPLHVTLLGSVVIVSSGGVNEVEIPQHGKIIFVPLGT
jgi:hypothetical protein